MIEPIILDAGTVRALAACAGLELTPEQAAALPATLQKILSVDAAITALKLGTLPAVGYPWGDWTDEPDRRG